VRVSTDPQHPAWGIGTVLDAIKLSEFPISLASGTTAPAHNRPALSIRFADGAPGDYTHSTHTCSVRPDDSTETPNQINEKANESLSVVRSGKLCVL